MKSVTWMLLGVGVAGIAIGCSSSSGAGAPGAAGDGGGGGGGGDVGSVAGTWTASAIAISYGTPGTTPTMITTGQTLVVTESGDTVDLTFTNDDETDGTCSGSISGDTITSTCSLTQLAGDASCTASFTRTDTVDASASPKTMTTSYSYTAGGGSACGYSGNLFTLSGTLTFKSS